LRRQQCESPVREDPLDFASFGRSEREPGSIGGALRRQQCESPVWEDPLKFVFARPIAS